MDPTLVEVTDFDWPTLLDSRGCEAVPDGAFQHVELSLDTGLKSGMAVEIPLDEEQTEFWLATIDEAFGPLLKLTYVGEPKDKKTTREIWHDLNKKRLFPLGWCQMNKIQLEPPESVKRVCPEWNKLALEFLEDPTLDTIPMHHIDGEGVSAAERIKPGMGLEIQAENDPQSFWPVEVKENRGGYLTLEYLKPLDAEKDSKTTRKHLFYTSERLFPLKHTVSKGFSYRNCSGENKSYQEMESDYPKLLGVPSDLIEPTKIPQHKAKISKDMHLELIDPDTCDATLARITQVWDECYFSVKALESERSQLCHVGSLNIFPVGWGKDFLRDYDKIEKRLLEVDKKSQVKKSVFSTKESAEDAGFSIGQKLDIAFNETMRSGTVSGMKDHVLKIRLDSDDEEKHKEIFISCVSDRLFPLGWSQTNNIPCLVPKSFLPPKKEESKEAEGEESSSSKKEDAISSSSSWCPEVFFNYKCFSSNFLAKARLATLPQKVGPGNVELVMTQILSFIIGSSYKSASILKRLECHDDRPRVGFILRNLKAKSRVLDIKGDVEVPTLTSQVNDFCREVCGKLGACPNLISTTKYDEDCPAHCMIRSKLDQIYPTHDENGQPMPKRRGGRKRRYRHLYDTLKQQESSNAGGNKPPSEEQSSSDESNATSATGSNVHSRSASPDNENKEPRLRGKRKEWDTILPRSEIRTRGAKLPDYKLHLKIRPTKREQKAIQRNSLKESIGFDKKRKKLPSAQKARDDKKLLQQQKAQNVPENWTLEPAFKIFDSQVAQEQFEQQEAVNGNNHPNGGAIANGAAKKPASEDRGHVVKAEPLPQHCNNNQVAESNAPPPIYKVNLMSNPAKWSCHDVAQLISDTEDCHHLAQFMVADKIDGIAFMLLNYQTVKEYWSLTYTTAVSLCRYVEAIKLAYWQKYL